MGIKLIPACRFLFIGCMVFALNQSNPTGIGLKYRIIPKRNSIQVACSILIIKCLPQVSLIPNLSLSVISAFFIKFHINIISNFTLIFIVFLLNIPFLHKDPNGYKESWLGLIHKCGRIPVQTCEESFILISGV